MSLRMDRIVGMNAGEDISEHHPIIFTETQLLYDQLFIDSSPPSPERAMRSPLKVIELDGENHHDSTYSRSIKFSPAKNSSPLIQHSILEGERLKTELEQLQNEYDGYKVKVENEKEELEKQLTCLRQELSDVTSNCTQLQEDFSSLQATYSACKSQLSTLHQTLSCFQTDRIAATAALSDVQSSNQKLSTKLDLLRERETTLLQHNQRLIQDNQFLSTQLHQMTELLHKLTPQSMTTNTRAHTIATAQSLETEDQGTHTNLVIGIDNDEGIPYQLNPLLPSRGDVVEGSITQNEAFLPAVNQCSVDDTAVPKVPFSSSKTSTTGGAAAGNSGVSTMSLDSLESSLLSLNRERDELESEIGKFPSGYNGKTGCERRRKVAIESRLSEIGKEIGFVKRELKKRGAL